MEVINNKSAVIFELEKGYMQDASDRNLKFLQWKKKTRIH